MSSSIRAIPIVESSRLVKVCCTQFSMTNDINQNILTAESIVRLAAEKGGNIILLPELFSNLYFCQDQLAENFSLAMPNDIHNNHILKKFKDLSYELNVVLPISFFEQANQAYYNSCVVFDNGKYLGIYRKSHVPDGPGYTEKFYFNPGDTGFQVFNTQYGKIGLGICWDQWSSECSKILSLCGAELLFYPTAIGSEPNDPTINSRKHWTNAMKGHAACNLTPVIVSNRIGTENQITFYGGSFITDQTGEIVESFENEQDCGIQCHVFDLTSLKKIRREWGIFRDRRPDLYSPILTLDGGSIKVRDFSTGTGYDDVVDTSIFNDLTNTPKDDGYFMPAEWIDHVACWMAYPYNKRIWSKNAIPAQKAVINVAKAISKFETVIMLVKPEYFEQVKKEIGPNCNIKLSIGNYEDIWLRDSGPTFLVNKNGNVRNVRGVNWKFNGWGNKVDNLDVEDTVSSQILNLSGKKGYKTDAVLEGGSIHTDGEGTLLTTEECVLNENRSSVSFATRSKESIDDLFSKYLGITKVIYIPKGVYNDEDTNGHIDNLCTFIRPGEVLLSFPDDPSSPQYPASKEAFDILSNTIDAQGRKLIVHKIPHPWPLLVTKIEDIEDLEPYTGTDVIMRNEGTILAGSYVNYYLANGEYGKGIVMPKFGIPTDIQAFEVMKTLFPDREVLMVEARDILLGGGNIHCITQQQPKV